MGDQSQGVAPRIVLSCGHSFDVDDPSAFDLGDDEVCEEGCGWASVVEVVHG